MTTKLPAFHNWFLSILILLLIPLIFLLQQMGPKDGDLQPPSNAQSHFSLTQLQPQPEDAPFGPAWRLDLATDDLVLLFKLSHLPSNQWPMPDWVTWQSQWRAGYLLLSLRLPASQRPYQDLLLLIEEWLPADGLLATAAIGPNTDDSWQALLNSLARLRGEGELARPINQRDVTALSSPATGTVEQIAFILASQWLRPQLSGYAPTMRWDHSLSPSQLLINQSVPRTLQAMDDDSFQQLHQQLQAQAEQERDLEQISNYMLVLLADALPASFITEQQQRLQALQLQQVNHFLHSFSER